VNAYAGLAPRTMEGQMIAILALSLALLLAVLAALEAMEQEDVVGWAQNEFTLSRLRRMTPAVEYMDAGRVEDFLRATSSCHEGYTLTERPFPVRASVDSAGIVARVARELAIDPQRVRAGRALLKQDDFSYRSCRAGAIAFPVAGIVVSLRLRSGKWLNAEVHPHEWHVRRDMIGWVARTLGAFLFVGAIALFFVHRLSRPLNELTGAARLFGQGLQASSIREDGPPDLKRAIRSFNAMQQQVADELKRRTQTLAAISHDVRTPLTALRIKAELVEDEATRADLVSSIQTMERITASALEFLRGESRGEPMRTVELGALLESECSNFQDTGRQAVLVGEPTVRYACRPDALACAVRNLIENAIKYSGAAEVTLRESTESIEIGVSDRGPGIPEDRIAQALEPFERLSQARESGQGGFGLGLAIVKAIVEGHEGELVLEPNQPTGLVATIRLPRR
jgi:signal transduction histidine kinase